MGRIIIPALIVVCVVLLWKAFGPGSRGSQSGGFLPGGPRGGAQPPQIKGPDDDEEFLWTIEKNRFKARRAQEEAEREEAERLRRAKERYSRDTTTPPEPDEEDS
ncbi:hypothetical protein ACUY3K_10645 [Corynebacterium uberis]|uniref:hypothetical protein n=1 Tax=Corynebacterium TaxID=1716 RepID=UPI001D09C8C2|nr:MULTISPECIES: hypothetical protein [Corynebacterium]MCZ9309489.1 hypothetical protein [Corynebacterium sp. c6VSa_13]UDL73039.1 hypothetical protein LH391_07930 [Corynebacterium uberis]UDL76084.1 hypothetical protein LH393_01460 [Corynebacterium uberis]UDL78296.1 hypothetical protein LH394_01455 [Corynebacterium uberis]UDL80579.1 hypothetical protein LH392_01885 [Corynebacterium uberis]